MKRYRAVYTAATLVLLVCGAASACPERLRQAANFVTAGQWEAALSALPPASENADPSVEALRGLLVEHQILLERRRQQRLAVFEEKSSALRTLDPNTLNEDASALKAMEFFKDAWDNASAEQREHLLTCALFRTLKEQVHQRFVQDRLAGRWDTAVSRWLRWLLVFDPAAYAQASDDLEHRRALANALRQDPCDPRAIPYANVSRQAAARVFEILQTRYAEPMVFDRLSAQGLRRLAMLPEVFGNPTMIFAVQPDPNGFTEWTRHLEHLQSAKPPTDAEQMAALLDTLRAINSATLKLPEGAVVAPFTGAALEALDPYTEAVWPEDVELFEKNLTGQFGGVGIRIKKEGEELVIFSIIPETPAAQTELAADDVIVAVDGQPTREMTTDCAVKRISGTVGTAVSLTVRKPGSGKEDIITVMRQKIVLPTVEGAQRADNGRHEGRWEYFLDARDRIGYLQLSGFTDKTARQAQQALEQLEQQQVAGLIIDMRGNGGGLLSEATAFADLFIGDGVLLSSRGREGDLRTWTAHPNAVERTYPLVILIDEGSASASEIVAGVVAVRKPGQVTLIGQRTYGKGAVQEIADLGASGGRLKLTTAYYYLPDGQPVPNRYKLQADGRTDWGIAPDIDIPLYAYEKAQIQKLKLERRRQLMARNMPTDEVQTESLIQQMLMADPQLSAALIVLKTRILTGF